MNIITPMFPNRRCAHFPTCDIRPLVHEHGLANSEGYEDADRDTRHLKGRVLRHMCGMSLVSPQLLMLMERTSNGC
jgi:hypothetical protein